MLIFFNHFRHSLNLDCVHTIQKSIIQKNVTVHAIIATLAYAHSHYALILPQECANRLALQRWTSADFHFYCAWFLRAEKTQRCFWDFISALKYSLILLCQCSALINIDTKYQRRRALVFHEPALSTRYNVFTHMSHLVYRLFKTRIDLLIIMKFLYIFTPNEFLKSSYSPVVTECWG